MAVHLVDKRDKRIPNAVVVSDLPAPEKGNHITYDSEVRGFGVRVTAGGAKSFILNYRNKHGTERRLTIGSWPDWSVSAARTEAAQQKRQIDLGRDPMAERHHERQAPTVAALCDRYLAEHVNIHNKPRTIAENKRIGRGAAASGVEADTAAGQSRGGGAQQNVQPRRTLEAAPAQ